MNSITDIVLACVGVAVGGAALGLSAWWFDRWREFWWHLEPIVRAQGFRLLSGRKPKRKQSPPFPDEDGTFRFRIVQFADEENHLSQAWARLRLKGMRVVEIDWHPDFRMVRT